ncbi:MAG: DUF1622 domain-containing protein [Myxococcota bacterium]
MTLIELAEYSALGIEAAAGVVIVVGLIVAAIRALLVGVKKGRWDQSYERLRQSTGRALLLGLELLVAADIIQTIIAPTRLHTIAVLGLTILIRTFLSMALQVEIDGRWPWQTGDPKDEISV